MRKLISLLLFVTLNTPLSEAEVGYLHGEHLQSTAVISDSRGGVQEALQYSPFGERISFAPAQRVSYQFTGQEVDFESDLYHYGFRGYDPSLSRFLSVDPVLVELPYAYVRNNPVRLFDPEGHQAVGPDDDDARFREGVLKREEVLRRLEREKEAALGGREPLLRELSRKRLEENRGNRLAELKDLLRMYGRIQERSGRNVRGATKGIERRIKAVEAEQYEDWEEASPKIRSEVPYSGFWGSGR
ncbi:MAG: RHS repeat-associated core domain-containing protein [Deltaproteobacteria bacterium]|nr:RHS repeat-associated core domain-containing protein [Deltaproteobacteria bacterium]